jgi:hypothetical protein
MPLHSNSILKSELGEISICGTGCALGGFEYCDQWLLWRPVSPEKGQMRKEMPLPGIPWGFAPLTIILLEN